MGCESGGQRVQIATETGDLAADLKTWAGLSAIVLHPVRGRRCTHTYGADRCEIELAGGHCPHVSRPGELADVLAG